MAPSSQPRAPTSQRGPLRAVRRVLSGGVLVGVAITVVACTPKPQTVSDRCGDFHRTGHARRDLAALVRGCGPGLPVTPIEERAAQKDPQRFAFEASGDGRCYRVLAAGDAGVTTMAVRVRDPRGLNLVETTTPRSFAVVPERALLCLTEPGFYYVDVAVIAGSGGYALQVLESQ